MIQSDETRNDGTPAFLAHAFDWVEFRRIALRRQQHYLRDLVATDEGQIVSGDGLVHVAELGDVKGSR